MGSIYWYGFPNRVAYLIQTTRTRPEPTGSRYERTFYSNFLLPMMHRPHNFTPRLPVRLRLATSRLFDMHVSPARLFRRDLEHMMTVIDAMGQGLDDMYTAMLWTNVETEPDVRVYVRRAVETCEDLYDQLRLARDLVSEPVSEACDDDGPGRSRSIDSNPM